MGMRKEVMIGTDDGAERMKALMDKPLKLARTSESTLHGNRAIGVRSVQSSMESAIRQMGHMRLSRSHFWRQASWNLDIHVFAVSITFILGMTEIAGS